MMLVVLVGGCRSITPAVHDRPQGTVIFTIGGDRDHLYLRPIAVYRNGQYTKPPCRRDGDGAEITTDYFRVGRQFTVVSGGRQAGTATIRAEQVHGVAAGYCFEMEAHVRLALERPITLGNRQEALALPIEAFRETPRSLQRWALGRAFAPPTAWIGSALVRIGVPQDVVPKLRVSGHTVDLEGSGNEKLVVEAHTADDERAAADTWHDVFVVMDRFGDGVLFGVHKQVSSERESEFCTTEFLDVLDLDGDGIVEIFVRFNCYEGIAYGVYQRTRDGWKRVYEGAYYGL